MGTLLPESAQHPILLAVEAAEAERATIRLILHGFGEGCRGKSAYRGLPGAEAVFLEGFLGDGGFEIDVETGCEGGEADEDIGGWKVESFQLGEEGPCCPSRFFVAGPSQKKEGEGDVIGVDPSWGVSTSGEGAILIFFAYLIAE